MAEVVFLDTSVLLNVLDVPGKNSDRISERRHRTEHFAAFLSASLQGRAPWVVSGASWDAEFLRSLLEGDGQRPGLVEFSTRDVGAGDASILLELQRYKQRSDVPSRLPIEPWTLDKTLEKVAAAYA